jgi:CheY-like chemotaxis protein
LDLINKILDISKIEAGSMTIKKSAFFPLVLIDEVVELYLLLATKKGITITKNSASNLENVQLIADKNNLIQILSNLLSNAVKYTKSGSIEIGCDYSSGFIRFFVSDTGLGISEEAMSHLFERFYQVNTNANYNAEGSGLGLSLSKALVELMGGKIEVTSKLGEGSKFSFSIPCEFLVHSQSVEIGPIQLDRINENEILLVEDDYEQLKFLKAILEKFNVKTLSAQNGIEAIKLVEKSPNIKVVLMDINMPELNGFDAAREIRKHNPKVPIIAMTGYSNIYEWNDALFVGCNDFVVKPVKREHITKIVNKYFQ